LTTGLSVNLKGVKIQVVVRLNLAVKDAFTVHGLSSLFLDLDERSVRCLDGDDETLILMTLGSILVVGLLPKWKLLEILICHVSIL